MITEEFYGCLRMSVITFWLFDDGYCGVWFTVVRW